MTSEPQQSLVPAAHVTEASRVVCACVSERERERERRAHDCAHGAVSREGWVFMSTETHSACIRVCTCVCTDACLCVCVSVCLCVHVLVSWRVPQRHTHPPCVALPWPPSPREGVSLSGSEPSPEGRRAAGGSGAPAGRGWRSGSPWASLTRGFLKSPHVRLLCEA